MIRFCCLFSGLCLLFAQAVIAEPVLVQSGEHGTFSRLVTLRPAAADWEVRQEGRLVSLTIQGMEEGFDVSDVFRFIPRTRIADLDQKGNTLLLTLACDCRVAAFLERDRFVVLDVAAAEANLAQPFVPLARARPRFPPINRPSVSADPVPLALNRAPLQEEEQALLDVTRNRLAEEVGYAATRGLLEASSSLPVITPRRPQISPELLPVNQPTEQNGAQLNPLGNIRISSARDLPEAAPQEIFPQSDGGGNCLAEEHFDIATWSSDLTPFHVQIGEARRALYGETGKVDPAAARHLSRLYVYFGFGAEAVQISELAGSDGPADRVLAEMGQIIDEGNTTGTTLPGFSGCGGDVALWVALAGPKIDPLDSFDPKPVLRALGKLPLALRQRLAPMLAERLRAYGDRTAAQTALATLTRQSEPLSEAAQLTSASLDLDRAKTRESAADEDLEELAETGGETGPEALLRLIANRVETDRPLPGDKVELLTAYAYELAETALGERLRQARAAALAQSGQIEEAFEALSILADTDPANETDPIAILLLDRLTRRGEDILFLEKSLQQPRRLLEKLERPTALAMADRYLNLGFAEDAQRVLLTVPDRPRETSRQMLAARVAMALQQPFRARAELVGIEGQEADLLRARASEMAGAHADAHDLYQLSGNASEATRTAWLAEQWDSEALKTDPLFGPVAAASLAEAQISSSTEGMLSRTAAALEESAAARRALEALLASDETSIEMPADPGS